MIGKQLKVLTDNARSDVFDFTQSLCKNSVFSKLFYWKGAASFQNENVIGCIILPLVKRGYSHVK